MRPSSARLADFLESLGVSTDPARYGIAETDWEPMLQAALAGPRGQNFIKPAGELEKLANSVD